MPCVIEFTGGDRGPWRVTRAEATAGARLEEVAFVSVGLVSESEDPGHLASSGMAWRLRGAISNLRYTTRDEANRLRSLQAALDRPTATHAALIPIKKSQQWWDLAQDERREIFEETSKHTTIGMNYLPAIARRLHHSRDLREPFDFLTWFEFAPEHEADFEALLSNLRATREWTFVEREVDIRLTRD
ncbi:MULTISPECIES: chlorite dismutase family protein [Methylobacterium]|uniref:Protein of unassigned function n=2 Tax=Methylobacterium TaxID=407 RepID=A0A089NLH3_9HYPH|nr:MULTISPECIES: chlorite dismutase family protein [Methylobacterium]AIQ88232.1 protein of unassigned function [Methylobacterium oryzae CBMB20]WFS08284.1 chlorite dismutase family protein [Methylobacterium sp. 391_Methyba4]